MPSLAIDFGTSNTAAAVLDAGQPLIIPLEPAQDTLPTAVFFAVQPKAMLIGQAAVDALTDGREGRFLRALKSVLGTPLAHEMRTLGGQRLTLIEVIARFLAEVKARAERHCDQRFDAVLSGRPVHFHTRDPARDAQALADLTECYQRAGFAEVRFMPEPEAAALAAARTAGPDAGVGLVVDIGGGTSDFTVFRGRQVLASHGIRLGGTDLDRMLSLIHVMPLLGKNTELRAVFGPQTHTAPVAIYHDLATWATIPFVYTPQTRRDVALMVRQAVEPVRFARLLQVLDMELGHDIAFAVEHGKIAGNRATGGIIDLRCIGPGLPVPLDRHRLAADLAAVATQITAAASQTCAMAGQTPDTITRVVLVGGSSLMDVIEQALRATCRAARFEQANVFTAVVDGLALATAEATG